MRGQILPDGRRGVITYQYAYSMGPGYPSKVSLCVEHSTDSRDPVSGRPLGPVEHGLHLGTCAACQDAWERTRHGGQKEAS